MNIKELRGKLDLSQQELSDKTGIPKHRIEKWEINKGNPKADDYIILQTFFRKSGVLESNDEFMKVDTKELQKEANMASIMSNIKIEYLAIILAEIQEKIDETKNAETIVSTLEMNAQSDFDDKMKRMRLQ